MTRTRVAATADLKAGGLRRVEADGIAMCLVHAIDGNFYCVDDQCSHEQESLSEGFVLDLEIECPAHGSLFDLRTGAVRGVPATEPVRTYPVTVVNGDVFVDLPPSPDAGT
jgi:3-phenylpropionate/trans-cinnamate dioxygenase ferredoxin subunit